jgi:hypothetical protein
MANPNFREVERILARIPDRNNIPGLSAEGMKAFFRLAVQNMKKHCQNLEKSNYDFDLRARIKTERAEAEVLIHEIIDIWLEHMANKPIAPEGYNYKTGSLTQWCSECKWKADRLKQEEYHCPECGAPVAKDCKIVFGGTTVRFRSRKNRFYLSSRNSAGSLHHLEEIDGELIEECIVFEADFPDTIVFMLRHGNFWA